METKIRIAIQKKGRLSEESLSLLKECGIKCSNGAGKLKADATNFPLEFLFLRDDDIPGYVADGVADLGIVGENVSVEKAKDVNTIKKLGFSKCRLSIAIPKGEEYTGIQSFEGKSIATSYTNLLASYLKENKVTADIHEISGSVEIAPGIGLTDAVCDIVSTGSTLMSNGLKEAEVIFRSEAVLIASKKISEEKQALIDKMLFRIKAVQKAKKNKYIMLNAPNSSLDKIEKILPGVKSPTITPLKTEGWSSIQAVIEEETFWDVIENLKEGGAENIIVLPIEKMIN